MAQALRRIIQTLSLLLILMLPLLGLAAALYQAYGPHGGHLAWVAGGRGHWLLHGALEKLSELGFEPSALPESFTGTLWSLRLFGLELADPLAALSFSLSAGEIYTPLLAAVLIPLGLAFLMGRAFCGWACPVNTLGELAHGLRARLEGRGLLRAYDFSFSRSNKYFLLLAGLTATFLSGYSLIHLLLPYLALGRGVYLYVFFGSLSVALALPLGILLFEFFISRRGWCRYFCPAGGLLALIGRVSLLRVEGKENMSCPPSCVSCLESCGMGLNPRAERLWPECHFCLRCISSCPKSLIGVRVAPIGRTALGAFVILLVIFFSFSLARAHHIMGLPHYGYADNYPQVPSKEHVLREGPYTVYAVCFFFEGLHREKSTSPDDVQLYLAIHDEQQEKPYQGPLTIELRDGTSVLATYRRQKPDEENTYRVRHALPPGVRELGLRVLWGEGEGKRSVSFPLELERRGFPWRAVMAVGLVVAAALALVLFWRRALVRAA